MRPALCSFVGRIAMALGLADPLRSEAAGRLLDRRVRRPLPRAGAGLVVATVALWSLGPVAPATACTSVYLTERDQLVFGNNLDWFIDDALLVVNKRQLRKRGAWGSNPPEWVSKYASLTTNLQGVGFPNRGMNEAGLVIGEMWLPSTRYPERDARPSVDVTQWIQYQLDTAATVAEVLASDQHLRIDRDEYPSHFLVCDRSGACAVVEWLEGRLRVHTDPDLKVKALVNAPYAECLARGDDPTGRFAKASRLLKSYAGESAVDYVFGILDATRQPHTRWSLVFDIKNLRLHYSTVRNPARRTVALGDFDLSCASPAQLLDINAPGSGDVRAAFASFTPEENERVALAMLRKWADRHGPIPEADVTKILRFHEATVCLSPQATGGRPTSDLADAGATRAPRTPRVFAPDVVSTPHLEHSAPTFSPDQREAFWSLWHRPGGGAPQVIMRSTRMVDGDWSAPLVAPFSGEFSDGSPSLSPDGTRLYFDSNRPCSGSGPANDVSDIWYVERQDEGWGPPRPLALVHRYPEIQFAVQPSVAGEGTLYFVGHLPTAHNGIGVYVTRPAAGGFARPEALGPEVNPPGTLNWTPFVDRNERYLLFSSNRPGGRDAFGDLYCSVADGVGGWSHPLPLEPLNTDAQERFPSLSPDGQQLFFTRWTPERDHDVFWIAVPCAGLPDRIADPKGCAE